MSESIFWLVELVFSPPCKYLGVITRVDGVSVLDWTGLDKALRFSRHGDAIAMCFVLSSGWFGLTQETRVTEHIEERRLMEGI